jgi:hypothetical protein
LEILSLLLIIWKSFDDDEFPIDQQFSMIFLKWKFLLYIFDNSRIIKKEA